MDAQAGMLARLFERSMGLGDEWEVSDVWFEEREGALQDVYSCAGRESAARALDRLCSWMMHSNVREMKTVARTLRKEREGILNWWKRGSTNSFLEGLNSVVQSVRSAARGFRSIAYFRTMIFLRLGRLDFTAQKKLACATH